MKRVWFLLLCTAMLLVRSPALAGDAVPPGIVPSTITFSQILRAYRAAVGALPAGMPDTRTERWTFTKAGLGGSETLIRSGDDYFVHLRHGATVEEFGRFFGKSWHLDENGVVSPAHATDYRSFEMQILMRSFGDAFDPKNDVKVLGEVEQPSPAYVLQIHLSGSKRPEWVFFDKRSGLIDKIVRARRHGQDIQTYGDYRTTSGLTEPWHMHFTDGDASLDEDFVRQSLVLGQAINPAQFAVPHSDSKLLTLTGPVRLPEKVVWDLEAIPIGNRVRYVSGPNVVVRVTVGGRGLDFALSSGENRSFIDFDVAQQLGLTAFGQVTHDEHGNPVAYDAVIPSARIGPVTLHNFAVEAVPFHYHLNGETKIVGLLGYDVLSCGVFKIDFVNDTLVLDPASSFDAPHPVPGAIEIPIHFDDGRPFIDGMIADEATSNIWLDNDFDYSMIFGSFVDRYPSAVKDLDGNAHAEGVLPFADSRSYGRKLEIWDASVSNFNTGFANIINYRIMAANEPVDFHGHQVDAVLGGDLLSNYDVYLDYPHSRILLKPNKNFYKTFKAAPPH